jgi:hypothetical protein
MESWDAFARAEPDLAARGRDLLYQRGDGEAFLTTVAANGTPRIHPPNQHYALHAHQDAEHPHEFMVRGQARLVTDPALRAAAAADWFYTVSEAYPLYELLIEHALLGERKTASDWPPRYRSWRSG